MTDSKALDATRHTSFPQMSAVEFQIGLVYVLKYSDASAIVVGAKIEFRGGGRAKLQRTTLGVPRLSEPVRRLRDGAGG